MTIKNGGIDIIFDVTKKLNELSKKNKNIALEYFEMMCDIKNQKVDVVDLVGIFSLNAKEMLIKSAILKPFSNPLN